MAPTKPAVLRRSDRIAKAPAAALPVHIDSDDRVSKTTPPPNPIRHDCSTCDRSLAASAFHKRTPTKACTHDVHTCKNCLKSWLAAQLDATTFDKLSCPECTTILAHADVKRVAGKQLYDKYDDLERRAFRDKTPGWRWCLAPKCRAGQVHAPLLQQQQQPPQQTTTKTKKTTRAAKAAGSADGDVFTCETCGARACVPCDRPYHDGETCAQYGARVERQTGAEEEASRARIASACKPCPKCRRNIEKSGGCDQVMCTQCGESFCWLCSTSYTVINKQGHAAGCTYAQAGRFDPHAAPNAPGNVALQGAGGWGGVAFFVR